MSTNAVDTAAVLDAMGYGGGESVHVHINRYGQWFWALAQDTTRSDAELRERSIDFIDTVMAIGLPGAEDPKSYNSCPGKLDALAEHVRRYTEAHDGHLQRSPEKYGNSLAQFRMSLLVTFVQEALGVRAGPVSVDNSNGADSRSFSVHGIMSDDRCPATGITLPVLYVAIGRRLQYPLYLVQAKGCYFVRWEESNGDYFNIDATLPEFKSLDDKRFRDWPQEMSDHELRSGLYFHNLSARGQYIHFLLDRIRCLIDNLRMAEALQSCWLLARFAGGGRNPIVRDRWATVTIMARTLEKSRLQAGVEDYESLDLRNLPVPEGAKTFENKAASLARKELDRLAAIRENAQRRTKEESVAGFPQGNWVTVTGTY